ncbi:FAD-dependent oxidoreductase [Streptomyces zagrosensis]|uniref:Isorenieratene synthase n=1 Tax=Streptomyces zagrosensis TaxID=1042984 RepID=A0A7W9QGD0_9ACTN|nr:FAD-dependent oxidoreductase [Streptomyces zagrosensis]MBB5939760.1 isorenieratene synthase [Streptomyces zagrosensis]
MNRRRTTRLARDRRATYWPAPPGAPQLTDPAARTAVVGGGIAGLAAATALAERGMRVDLLEQQAVLGGRVSGWTTRLADGTEATMSRGFHAFFRQYYNLRNLLRRTDPALTGLVGLPDYPLHHAAGHRDRFAQLPRTPPWNVLAFAATSPTFTAAGMSGMNPRAALHLLDVQASNVYGRLDHLSAHDFLNAVRFPPPARHLAFEVFSRSFFADPRELSAAELALMFHIYFLGSAEGLLFDVPAEPFPTALWDPLAARLDRLGARVRTRTRAEHLEARGGNFALTTTDACGRVREERYDAVVLALDTGGLRALAAASPKLGGPRWRKRIDALRQAPPFLVSRYWLDRPVAPHRPAFLGTSGYGPLDNISILSRYEGQAARWARQSGGSVVELHAYAVDADADRVGVQHRLRSELARIYPETAGAVAIDERHEWHADCPLFAPGTHADRPTVHTPHPRLVLAGDLVRTAAPVALMERAATTGLQAANVLLATWQVRGHPLLTVPTAGRSPLLRTLARAFAPTLTTPDHLRRPDRRGMATGSPCLSAEAQVRGPWS